MAELGCKPRVAVEVDTIPAILHLLRPDEQFAILPKFAVSIYDNPQSYVSRRIVSPTLSSKLVLAVAARRKTNALYEGALKLICQICGAALRPIREMEGVDFPLRLPSLASRAGSQSNSERLAPHRAVPRQQQPLKQANQPKKHRANH
jgi:hypothetical protein